MKEHAASGDTIFYDIYTEKEKAANPEKEDTGLSEYSKGDPVTFVTVGESDGIANWRVMKQRFDGMSALGIDTEFHSYPGLSHGFGMGSGTVAEGWIDEAITFWQRQVYKL